MQLVIWWYVQLMQRIYGTPTRMKLINMWIAIFMHLKEFWKYKIAYNARNMKRYIKHSKHSAFYNTCKVKSFSIEALRF